MDQGKLQKPIPTTDGKQTTGHSYSTRSKVKRTSESANGESSGSKAQQPPLKRQTRVGGKQAEKSAEIKNYCVTIPDSNLVDTNIVDEYTPAEDALQNNLVLETLFSYMNWSDLLSCRVVNKQWQYEATRELRERKIIIEFYFRRHENQMRRNIAIQDVCRRLSECKTPSLLSSFQVKTVALNDLTSAGVSSFFSTVENQLKHLVLHLDYWRKRTLFKSSPLMTDLENLLFRQTPNLEFLEIIFDLPFHWETEMQKFDSLGQNQNDHDYSLLLSNLKTFVVSGSPAPKFLADVINAAVNLRSFEGDWSACIKYLMGAEGRTKIHLLKGLSFDLAVCSRVGWSQLGLELLETFLTEHKQNLKLETLECVSKLFSKDESFGPRFVNVINQILVCSSGSLQKLIIQPAKWFEDLLTIPRLPNLEELCFNCNYKSSLEWLRDGGGFLPRGFNMNNSFPNVSKIVLWRCAVSLFRLFVTRMEIEMTEPITSIRCIIMVTVGKGDGSVIPLASDFHHIFPNLLSISYFNSENYYKI